MKKVRYAAVAFGACGVLPGAALLAPATPAAAIPAPATAGNPARMPLPAAVAAACNAHPASGSVSDLHGYIKYSKDNGCIGYVKGRFHHHTSRYWLMRVRFYNNGKQVVPQKYLSGSIQRANDSISFHSSPHVNSVQQICETIVSQTTLSPARSGGPVCEQTGYSR